MTLAPVTAERIIDYPGAPPSIDTRIINYMVAQLGRRGCVYFVGFNKWVKIGFSSKIWLRVEKLDCLPGNRQDEDALHNRFVKYRTYAEWFLREGKLADHIQKLRAAAQRKCTP